MKSGIYRIRNLKTGRSYIGSSRNIPKRWAQHRCDLRAGRHHCVYLQRSWNKYGEEAFVFEVEESCKSKDLKEREKHFLETEFDDLYNLSKEAFGGDNISNHPELERIRKVHSRNGKRWWNSKTKAEKEEYRQQFIGEKNPNWKGGISRIPQNHCKCGKEIAVINQTCMRCRDRTGRRNPFFGRQHSDETKATLRVANRGRKPPNCRAVLVEGQSFPSVTEAGRQLGISPSLVIYRIRSPNYDYDYVNA